jgi:hypothetical protein
MLNSFIWISLPAALLAICLLACWRGAAAEQFGSLIILVADIAADLMLALAYPKFPEISMCAIDFALACGLLFIALRYSSLWLGGAMFLQSLALCLQAFDFAGDGPSTIMHVIANDLISYAMVACLIAGLIASWRKRQSSTRHKEAGRLLHAPGV